MTSITAQKKTHSVKSLNKWTSSCTWQSSNGSTFSVRQCQRPSYCRRKKI